MELTLNAPNLEEPGPALEKRKRMRSTRWTRVGKRFPGRLRRERLKRGLTQSDLAEQVGSVKQTLSGMETGKGRYVESELLNAISMALDVDAAWLADSENSPADQDARLYGYKKRLKKLADVGEGFPDRLRDLRRDKNYSQAELAEMIGQKRLSILRLEAGKNLPSYDAFKKLAEALDADPNWLYGDAREPKLRERLEKKPEAEEEEEDG